MDGHTKRTTFAVTSLGKNDILLGFTWLEEHNPEIDWQTQKVKMSRCPAKCHTCRTKIQKERKEEQREAQKAECHICTCRVGPFPRLPEEGDERKEDEERADVKPEGSWDEWEEGDRLMYVMLPPKPEHI